MEELRKGPFAIQLDETTTVADEAVVIIYVQHVDGENLKQDILMSVSLTTTTRGEDIFLPQSILHFISQSSLWKLSRLLYIQTSHNYGKK